MTSYVCVEIGVKNCFRIRRGVRPLNSRDPKRPDLGNAIKLEISKNGNSVFSAENNSMSDKFWQKVSHSIGNYKNVKTCQQCMSLTEKTEFRFFHVPIFGYCPRSVPFFLPQIFGSWVQPPWSTTSRSKNDLAGSSFNVIAKVGLHDKIPSYDQHNLCKTDETRGHFARSNQQFSRRDQSNVDKSQSCDWFNDANCLHRTSWFSSSKSFTKIGSLFSPPRAGVLSKNSTDLFVHKIKNPVLRNLRTGKKFNETFFFSCSKIEAAPRMGITRTGYTLLSFGKIPWCSLSDACALSAGPILIWARVSWKKENGSHISERTGGSVLLYPNKTEQKKWINWISNSPWIELQSLENTLDKVQFRIKTCSDKAWGVCIRLAFR